MNPGALIADGALLVAVPIAVLAGLASFLSPCVLPLVPGYLGFIGGSMTPRPPRATAPRNGAVRAEVPAGGDPVQPSASAVTAPPQPADPGRGRLLLGVVLFIAGFTTVFLAVVVLGGTLGSFFLAHGDIVTRILGAVVILLGLVFVGLFGVAQRTVRLRTGQNLGLVGAPLLGIALGVGWTPCIGPTLAAIISVSWNLGDPARAAVLGLAYSLGLGIPFVLLALGLGWAGRSVAWVRRHIRAVNIAGGVMLIVLGVLMLTGVWTALMSRLQGVLNNVPLPL